MNPLVVTVIVPTVDWKSLLGAAKQALSRNISEPMDKARREIKYPSHLIPILSELESPGANFYDCSPNNADHLHYGFLIVCDKDTYIELLSCSKRLVKTYTNTQDFYLIILSGSLVDLSLFTQECEQSTHSAYIKMIGSQISTYLETQDFKTHNIRLLK